MDKPRLVDLFCGAGGAAMGYAQAGFEVIGVDSQPQPRYPFAFVQADAMTFPLEGFAAIHASPPCQYYTAMLNGKDEQRSKHPDLVASVRRRLHATGKLYIIENVLGAPLENPIVLCGAMFGLRVYRHRLFESNLVLFQPAHPRHRAKAARPGKIPQPDEYWCPVGKFGRKEEAQQAMGITWMLTTGSQSREIAQAIPPAYTCWIGQQVLAALENRSHRIA